jgi:hypothetical protein
MVFKFGLKAQGLFLPILRVIQISLKKNFVTSGAFRKNILHTGSVTDLTLLS